MFPINGMKVYVTPDVPRMQLSEDCPVTSEFRDEINAWMISFFGVDNKIADGETWYMPSQNALYMNPRTFEYCRKDLPKPTADEFNKGGR